jgi:hypothetical protein
MRWRRPTSRLLIPWNFEPSQREQEHILWRRRSRLSGSFAGSSGELSGNYLSVRKNRPEIVENCAFWASLAHQSVRPNLDWLATSVGREYSDAYSESLISPRFLSFRLLMRQRSRDRSNRAA